MCVCVCVCVCVYVCVCICDGVNPPYRYVRLRTGNDGLEVTKIKVDIKPTTNIIINSIP